MYIIIVGAGKIGSSLIELATGNDHDIVVIEKQEAVASEIDRQFDCLVINADATSRESLQEAGINEADAIITTTDADAVNLMVCMLGKEMNVPSIVSVIHDEGNLSMFRELGVNVMANPPNLIADHLYRAVQRPSIKDFMSLENGAEVFEITVTDEAEINGMSLMYAKEQGVLSEDTNVVCISRSGELIVPDGGTQILSGDLVTILSLSGADKETTRTFTG
ncbi:MAG: TrkA family potassium uptake protein [bacterium]